MAATCRCDEYHRMQVPYKSLYPDRSQALSLDLVPWSPSKNKHKETKVHLWLEQERAFLIVTGKDNDHSIHSKQKHWPHSVLLVILFRAVCVILMGPLQTSDIWSKSHRAYWKISSRVLEMQLSHSTVLSSQGTAVKNMTSFLKAISCLCLNAGQERDIVVPTSSTVIAPLSPYDAGCYGARYHYFEWNTCPGVAPSCWRHSTPICILMSPQFFSLSFVQHVKIKQPFSILPCTHAKKIH